MGGGSQAAWPQDTLVTAYSRLSTPPMDLTTLKEESRRLARRSYLLTQAGEGEPAGWLLGEGNQIALRLEERIVRAVGDGRGGGELEVLAKTPSGAVPLYAVERVSFAPIEAIFSTATKVRHSWAVGISPGPTTTGTTWWTKNSCIGRSAGSRGLKFGDRDQDTR